MSITGEIAEVILNIEPNNEHPIIRYDKVLNCLHGVMEGTLDLPAIEDYVAQVVQLAEAYDCTCILSDLRRVDLALSILEIYELPALMERMGFGRPWRGALVISGNVEEFRFLETVAQNQGFRLRVFDTLDHAAGWIRGEGSK